jgi:serine phosphatase RsbU (regulator of sigma subunit)
MADPESGQLKIRAAVGLPEEISSEVSVQPGERISGKVFESGRPMVVNEGDPMPAESLNVEELRETDSFLSVPLKVSGPVDQEDEVLGVINLTRKRRSKMFTPSDLKLVSAVAVTTATQIHNCRLINAERERQKLEHELELAAGIQLGLLPEEPLSVGTLEAAGCCQPARHVGGDLFDYWASENRAFLMMADVAGHDMGAALMAAAVRSVMRGESVRMASVAELLDRVNRALFHDLVRAELFVTAFCAQIDVCSGQMSFCRAGHPKPLLVKPSERLWLDTEGLLLGMQEDGGYEQQTVLLEPGDTLVLYTDGVMDAADPDGRLFGADGVRAVGEESVHAAPLDLARRIVDAAQAHTHRAPQVDDMTTLVARFGADEPA